MNTAKTIITILLLAITQFAFAQKEPIPYEWFEEKSEIISGLQMRVGLAESKYYSGEYIRFWKDNFNISYSDKLASSYVTMKKGDIELTLLIEGIDFTEATGIAQENNTVYVYFPENSLTLQKYGEENAVEKRTYLDFYATSKDESDKMLSELYDLVTLLKIDKGLMTAQEAKQQHDKWKNTIETNTESAYASFLRDFPNSLFSGMASAQVAQFRQAERQRQERLRVEREKQIAELDERLALSRASLKYTKQKQALWLSITGAVALAGGYGAYQGFIKEGGNHNVGIIGGVGAVMGTTAFFAGNSMLYKPDIQAIRQRIYNYEQEKRQLSYIEVVPYSHSVMGNYYAGATIRIGF